MYVVAALALVLLVVAGLAFEILRVHRGGPLASFVGNRAGAQTRPGEVISFGQFYLTNESGEPVVVDRVTLVDPDPGLDVVGMYALPFTGEHFLAKPGFAAGPNDRYPTGLEIAPGEENGYDIIVGLVADKAGTYRADHGVRVEYHQGHKRFATQLGIRLTLCVQPRPRTQCSH